MTSTKLIARHDWAPGLSTLSIDAAPDFEAGQFFNLGLCDAPGLRRSYSAASAPGRGLEFLVIEVPGGALTPGLLQLRIGDSLEVDLAPQGFFTLNYMPKTRDAWLLATGTGLGPFIAMLRDPKLWDHFQRVVLVHGVRQLTDLAYASELRALEQHRGERFKYLSCTSRDASAPGLLGRIPAAISDGRLAAAAGAAFDPEHSHVLLCGNPQMIDDSQRALAELGLRKHRVRKPGHISFEKYW